MPSKTSTNRSNLQGEFVLGKKDQTATTVNNQQNVSEKNQTSEQNHTNTYNIKAGLTPGAFTTLMAYPQAVNFENQEEDEIIILLVRRDFVTNFIWIAETILLALLPILILPVLRIGFPFLNLSPLTQIYFTIFYYLIVFEFIIINFAIWYFNVSLVTNKRVVDVDVTGILFRMVSETKLELIQDVSYTQVGVIRSIFNYGDVFIQTAAEIANFEFHAAPEPEKIMRVLGDLIGKPKHGTK
ncbi:MAG: hypothetical protein A2857_01030 [Candidatus Levybacteria bacterium RIFCSPHIGHO2_01_FULL_36_15]|nr:MAG: hypothetical protein A2857_01030 [Candidatus Levybacteria bacterium RIFCSPHIGHO2_01_FULL_36_15]